VVSDIHIDGSSVFCASDLRFMVIGCLSCKTEITVDLSREQHDKTTHAVKSVCPKCCPTCETPFDSDLVRALDSIRLGYKMLAQQTTMQARVGFRVAGPNFSADPRQSN
jgi:hypothetical protein